MVGVIVIVLASSAVNLVFESRSGRNKGFEIDICCFSAKYAALRPRLVAYNQDNVTEWVDMSNGVLLFQ